MLICGVDEAGRGPLAGPVCAAAVILPERYELPSLTDSKKLSRKKREELYAMIRAQAVSSCVGWADVEEILALNILGATLLAMRRAVDGLSARPDRVLVDGNAAPELSVPAEPVVGGDLLVPAISAASVLAKVERDRYMSELALAYPQYGFDRHMGYGTAQHYEMLDRHGPCPAHRELFLRKWRAR